MMEEWEMGLRILTSTSKLAAGGSAVGTGNGTFKYQNG